MHAVYRHGAWIVALAALLLNLVHAARHDHLTSPPEVGDAVDYDSMGLNLARGRGFGYFRADPEWRAPYEAALADGQDQYAPLMMRDTPFERTTYRPPLFPILLAGIYATAGRHFVIWRVIGCLMGAVTAFLVFRLARRLTGSPAAGWTAGVLYLIDPFTRHLAGMYLTESLATLLVILFVVAMLAVIERPGPARFAAFGALLALAVLTRGIFIFLIPLAGAVALWKAWQARGSRGATALTVFILAAAALLAPWWIRNCLALEAFMPFGAQGWINMPAGYNDAAIENGGNWDWDLRTAVYQAADFSRENLGTKLETEKIWADKGRELTLRWIGANPEKLPALFAVKVGSLWGSSRFGMGALALAALGLLAARPFRRRAPFYAVLLVYTLGVGLTWATEGRFRAPMMPLVFVLAGDAVTALAMRLGWISGTEDRNNPAANA